MKKWENTGDKVLPIAFIVFLIILWEILIKIYNIPKYILPAPSSIISALIEYRQILWEHTKTTIVEASIGFVIATIFAIFAAGLMNKYELLKKIIYPIFVISQTVPIIALAPLFMIWLGFGILPKIVIVVLVCFFPIAVSVIEGLETVDQDLINLMKVMGAKPFQIFIKVQMPATLPAFFSGLKIAATYSIMGAVLAEWIGAKSGLGVYMTRAMNSFRIAALFADIFVVVILSIGIFQLIERVSKKIMPWNQQTNQRRDLHVKKSKKFIDRSIGNGFRFIRLCREERGSTKGR
ncbi:ABC transporter permease [Crassaminicella indica]|uniref:ABC transporter permease n=1 Tax=Crassaminicella indica TaxID=2855394 RepID=A0ABX8REJ3_9CLOT|nr:ABC transporter permease [Crassaminicella indica]QXM05361.1 ABC transporter permease [Crassaminicella indica]